MPIVSKIPAIVETVVKYSDSVVLYSFIPQKRLPRFRPGQFLHLALDPYDPSHEWPESRVFSILSSPAETDKIKLVISAKGNYTQKIINTLKVNDEVWLKLPFGDFTFENEDTKIVLIAGGTGIAPFISFLDSVLINKVNKNISLYYGVRNAELLIFEEQLEKYKREIDKFKFKIFIEQTNDLDKIPFTKGILDINAIYTENKDSNNCSYYLSGPVEMIRSFKSKLLEKGIDPNKIIIDSWE